MFIADTSRGLGDAGQLGVTLGGSAVTGVLAGLHAAGAIGGTVGAGIAAGAVSFGIGAVAALALAFLNRKGPKQKVATTQIANEIEPLLQQNLAAWNASAKTCADQAVALATFDSLWNSLVNACAQPSLGDPGHSCIDDRLPVGVEFEWNTFHLHGNGMWNWFAYYRDPIANALPNCCQLEPCYFPGCQPKQIGQCAPAQSETAAAVSAIFSGAGLDWKMVLIPAVLIGAAWVVLS